MSQNPQPPSGNGPLINQRSAVIFLMGALVGIGAGVLAVLAGNTWPAAVTTAGAGVLFFHQIID